MAVVVALLVVELIGFAVFKASTKVVAYALALPALIFVAMLLRRLCFHWSTVLAFWTVLTIHGSYIGYTNHYERNLDVNSQVAYIEYIADKYAIPPDNHCFICHHPPIYYGTAAAFYAITKGLALAPPLRGVQIMSLVTVFSFVLCTAMITRRINAQARVVALATLLCGLWPYTIILSARVHTDVLATAFMAWTIYFCVRWYQHASSWTLSAACIFASLSVLTKVNGLVVVGLVLTTVMARACQHSRPPWFFTKAVPPLLALVVGLVLFIGTRGSVNRTQEAAAQPIATTDVSKDAPELGERIFGSAFRIGRGAWMGNQPFNNVFFEVDSFLREPYALARKEGTGRQYFLNHWLKSSLFSTHNERPDSETSYRLNHRVAQIENFLLLGLIVYVAAFFAQAKYVDLRRHVVLALASVGLFAGAAAFRIVVPHAHHADFRHAFAILMPFTVAFALATAHYRRRDSMMEYVGYILAMLFLALSVFYFAPKYTLVQRFSPTVWVKKNQSEVNARVKAGTKWDDPKHIILEGTDALRVKLDSRPTVERIELSVDHNDKYRITVVGENEERTIEVGPHPGATSGMADYNEPINPPLEGVSHVVIRPLAGDRSYSIGHVIAHVTNSLAPTVK